MTFKMTQHKSNLFFELISLYSSEKLHFVRGIKQNGVSSEIHFLIVVSFNREGSEPGGRLNKKDGLTRYGDSHVKDKTS